MRDQRKKNTSSRAAAQQRSPQTPAEPDKAEPAPLRRSARIPDTRLLLDQTKPSTVAPVGETVPDRRWESVQDAGRADRLDAAVQRRESHRDEAAADLWALDGDVRDSRAEEARVEASHLADPQERGDAFDTAEDLQAEADATHQHAEPLYDSAERRQATARDLEARGVDREQVARHMRADISQAAPASQAPSAPVSRQAATPRRTAQARGVRGVGAPRKGVQR